MAERVTRGHVSVALAASLVAACSTDTAGLERRPDDGRSGGAAGVEAPAGGTSGGGSGGTGGTETPPPPPVETGTGAVTIVHGLVDGGRLFACLRNPASGALLGGDAPVPPEGLEYARGLRVPADWDLDADEIDIELFVASEVGDETCPELIATAADAEQVRALPADAGAPDASAPIFPLEPLSPRRAGALRLLPGLLRPGAHYALIAAGCSAAGSSPQQDACGEADPGLDSHRALVLALIAPAGSADPRGFGLQFVNASRAVPRADVVLQGETPGQTVALSGDVQFGVVRPVSAASVLTVPVGVELHVDRSTASSFTQLWTDTVPTSGEDALELGANYLLAYVGPRPGAVVSLGVAPPRFVLVRGP
jgi:hypothetical protein